jgi:hypothetical protein
MSRPAAPKWVLRKELKYRSRAVPLSVAKVQGILAEEQQNITIFLNEEGVLERGGDSYAFVTLQILQKL